MSRNQMGDPVRDYAGFAATRARQDQQGTLGMLHGLALAGVESVKEVHRLIVAWGTQGRKDITYKVNIPNNLRRDWEPGLTRHPPHSAASQEMVLCYDSAKQSCNAEDLDY
jgi:hypothetical protein